MTQYVLHVSSYAGIVPGARHYRGRVEGPYPESCHGGMSYNAPEARGKMICDEGHEIPQDRVAWDVEAEWTEERHERWAKAHFEGQSPQQFDTKEEVIDRAVIQFLDGSSDPCEEVTPAAEGDELWYGYVSTTGHDDDEGDGWGTCIATKNTG